MVEFLLIAALGGGLWYLNRKAGAPPAASGSGNKPGPTNDPGQGPPGNIAPYPVPVPPGPPPTPQPLPPGVYPANTPGAVPLQISCVGDDGYGIITAQPGGSTGPGSPVRTIWYGPGTTVLFSARVLPQGFIPPIFTGFDHFEGPGVATKNNPFATPVMGPGYVRAVFAFAGVVPR